MTTVYIGNNDPLLLLYKLHQYACLSKGFGDRFRFKIAKKQICPNGFAERICGVMLCVNIKHVNCDVRLYESRYGKGSFKIAIGR